MSPETHSVSHSRVQAAARLALQWSRHVYVQQGYWQWYSYTAWTYLPTYGSCGTLAVCFADWMCLPACRMPLVAYQVDLGVLLLQNIQCDTIQQPHMHGTL